MKARGPELQGHSQKHRRLRPAWTTGSQAVGEGFPGLGWEKKLLTIILHVTDVYNVHRLEGVEWAWTPQTLAYLGGSPLPKAL